MIGLHKKQNGFTLIELIIVVAIIGLLATLSIAALNAARDKALISRRLADMKSVQTALELYYNTYGMYPNSDTDGCGGWDIGNKNYIFLKNMPTDIMSNPPKDTILESNCSGYAYYRYPAGSYNCDPARGAFYVLGIRGTNTKYPASDGFKCPSRDWKGEFEWVVGAFES